MSLISAFFSLCESLKRVKMLERGFFFSYSFLAFSKFITCLLEDYVEFVVIERPCWVETLLSNKLYDEFTARVRKQSKLTLFVPSHY